MSSRQAESLCHGLNCVPRRDACVLTRMPAPDLLGGGAAAELAGTGAAMERGRWAWRQTLREGRRSRTAEDDHVAITDQRGTEKEDILDPDPGLGAVRPSASAM